MRMLYHLYVIVIFLALMPALRVKAEIKDDERLLALSDSLSLPLSDVQKEQLCAKIIKELTETLTDSSSFTKKFSDIKKIGIITSPDSAFKLFNWNINLSMGKAVSYTVLQKKPKNDKCMVFQLVANRGSAFTDQLRYNWQKAKSALFYSIIPSKVAGETSYLLLGLVPNDMLVQAKVIETLFFNELENPCFGVPVIKMNGGMQKRIPFQFSARVSMSLSYNVAKNVIVFDHLAPAQPIQSGKYEFYGPDASFDALVFKDNYWTFVSDYNLFNTNTQNR
jgi:hypothetical protein